MAAPIFVIGSSNTDMVIKSDRLPKPGETILGGTFLMNAGGKGANQAVAAARLKGNVTLCASVGDDVFGKETIEHLRRENINTEFVFQDKNLPSGIALINVDETGENCITVAPGSNNALTHDKLFKVMNRITPDAIVLLQLEIPLSTVEYVVGECHKRSARVILNPAPAASLKKEILQYVTVITPNETETQLLTGVLPTDEPSIVRAVSKFHNAGILQVVITLGERGAFWSDRTSSGFATAPKVKAVDTTAGGDCFNGALAVAIAEGSALQQAVEFACKAASVSVTRMGAQASMPYRNEVTS
jgi:ribokinase